MSWFSKAFKSVGKGLGSLAKGVVKGVGGAFKAIGKGATHLAGEVVKPFIKPLVPQQQTPELPGPSAQPAPPPEQTTEQQFAPENINAKGRKRRNGLRIDLNTGGGGTGNGVNLPRG